MAAMPALDWINDDADMLRTAYAAQRAEMADEVAGDVAISEGSAGALHFDPLDPKPEPILYFHGGGWIVGSPHTHVTLCSWLAQITGRSVQSVPYRLAPEHAYPAQRDDAIAALKAMAVPCFVVGDSAGGAMALWAESGAPGRTLGVVSLYGAFGVSDSPSLRRFGPGSDGLSAPDIASFYTRMGLTRAEDIQIDFASSGAPLLLIEAEADPLADDNLVLSALMADRELTHLQATGQPHAFLQFAGRDAAAREVMGWVKDWMDSVAEFSATTSAP